MLARGQPTWVLSRATTGLYDKENANFGVVFRGTHQRADRLAKPGIPATSVSMPSQMPAIDNQGAGIDEMGRLKPSFQPKQIRGLAELGCPMLKV